MINSKIVRILKIICKVCRKSVGGNSILLPVLSVFHAYGM